MPRLHLASSGPTGPMKSIGSLRSFLPWLIGGSLIVSLGVLSYFLFWRWWVVKTVRCQENGQNLPATACASAQSLIGQPMVSVDITAAKWSGLTVTQDDQQRWWYRVGWTKKLPDTVILQYLQSQPAYQFTQDNQTWWLVNEAGATQEMTATRSGTLSVLVQPTWLDPLITKHQMDPKLHAWLQAVQTAVKTQSAPLQQITLIDQFMVELKWPDWSMVLNTDQDPHQELNRLKQVQNTLSEKGQTLGKEFKRVDLRFKLPVLQVSQ